MVKLPKRQLIATLVLTLTMCASMLRAAGPLIVKVSGERDARNVDALTNDALEYSTDDIDPVRLALPEPIVAPKFSKAKDARAVPGDDMLSPIERSPAFFESRNSSDDPPPSHEAAMHVAPWGGEPPASTWSSGDWFRTGMWYTAADFTVVRRSFPKDNTQIGSDFSTGRILNAFGPTPGVEPGVRLTVGQFLGRDYLNRDQSVEFTFFGINEFSVDDGIESAVPGFLFLPDAPGLGGFGGADTFTTEYESRFLSYEANLRLRRRLEKDRLIMAPDGTWTRQFTRGYVPSLILGLRYASIQEDFDLQSRQLNVNPAVFGGDYNVKADNDLFGVQIGGDCLDQHENWHWGFRGKAGAYVNFAEQNSTVILADPSIATTNRFEQGERANASFLGEISLLSAYQFTPNFSVRASGDLMVVTGLALAPDQVQFATTPVEEIKTGGTIFYAGLSFGMEYVW